MVNTGECKLNETDYESNVDDEDSKNDKTDNNYHSDWEDSPRTERIRRSKPRRNSFDNS